MSNKYKPLVARLRELAKYSGKGSLARDDYTEAADAIEAQARMVENLLAEVEGRNAVHE